MTEQVTFTRFVDAFTACRPNTFTYDGLQALYDFLEDLDPDYNLDVIGLCGDYTELTDDELRKEYNLDIDEYPDHQDLRDYLESRTVIVGDLDDGFIFRTF